MAINNDVTLEQALDLIQSIRSFGIQLGDPNIVGDIGSVIKKCIEHFIQKPCELAGVDASKETQAIAEGCELHILIRSPSYLQRFTHYYPGCNFEQPATLSLENSEKQATSGHTLKTIAGDRLGTNKNPDKKLGYKLPQLLLDTAEKVAEHKHTYYLPTEAECKQYFKEVLCPKSCLVLPMQQSSQGHLGYFILKSNEEKNFADDLTDLYDMMANATARAIRRTHREKRNKAIADFIKILNDATSFDPNDYIGLFDDALRASYGNEVQSILFLRDRMTGAIEKQEKCCRELGFRKALYKEANKSEEHYEKRIHDLVRAFVLTQGLDKNRQGYYAYDFIKANNEVLDQAIDELIKEQFEKEQQLAREKKENSASKEISSREQELDTLKKLIEEKEASRPIFTTDEENSENKLNTPTIEKPGFHSTVLIPLHRKTDLSKHTGLNKERNNINIGCLIIRGADLPVKQLWFLDSLTDILAEKISELRRIRVTNLLDDFEHEIEEEILDEQALLEKMQDYISQVMNSENMFIALLNEQQEIKFPVFIQDGEVRHDIANKAEWNEDENAPRFFNPDSDEKGRVEWILSEKKSIFISTLQASKQWYNESGREEKIGNPYASWVGVPLKNKGKIIGVIAVFHPKEEHLYTQNHIKFLQRLSRISSHLLTNKQLEESNKQLGELNRQLEESQKKIAEQQHILSTSLLAQDVRHRVNNAVGGAKLDIEYSATEIKPLANKHKAIQFSANLLEKIQNDLENLLTDINDITNDSPKTINLQHQLEKILNNTTNSLKLNSNKIDTTINEEDPRLVIKTRYRTFYSSLSAIINNAGEALIERSKHKKNQDNLYLRINIKNKGDFYDIEVIDNGVLIENKNFINIFSHGFTTKKQNSGFGLWRAKTAIESLGGKLYLTAPKDYGNNNHQKMFVVQMPKAYHSLATPIQNSLENYTIQEKTAWVLDDERSWRDHIARWLEEEGYLVKKFGNLEEINKAINNSTTCPEIATIDLSLDTKDGNNKDGLQLVGKLMKLNQKCAIYLISGHTSEDDNNKVPDATIMQKFSKEGVLSKEKLIGLISDINEKPDIKI